MAPPRLHRGQLMRQYATASVPVQQRGEWWKAIHEVEVSSIPIPDEPPVVYINPKAWEELSARRMKYRAVDLTERTAQTKPLELALTQPVVLDFKATSLDEVVDFLREYTGKNIRFDESLANRDQLMKTPVTMTLDGISFKSALVLLLAPLNLRADTQDGMLVVKSINAAHLCQPLHLPTSRKTGSSVSRGVRSPGSPRPPASTRCA